MLMLAVLLLPALLQMLVMSIDELHFHRRRGLPLWERIGHPLDTLTAVACYSWLALVPPSAPHALGTYIALSAFSCLFITKDEFVHARSCDAKETFLHALLFVLHPIVFLAFGAIWQLGLAPWAPRAELVLAAGFGMYQTVYWSSMGQRAKLK
jgi:hypothetical protein